MEFRIEIVGLPEIAAKMDRLRGFLTSPKLRAALEDTKDAFVLLAQLAVPKRSRLARASIHGDVKGFGTEDVHIRWGAGGAGSAYVQFIEEGTKPHPITPRNRRWLHWYEDSLGSTVDVPYGLRGMEGYTQKFRKHVSHPGSPAQPFFFVQLPKVSSRLLLTLQRLMGEELNRS